MQLHVFMSKVYREELPFFSFFLYNSFKEKKEYEKKFIGVIGIVIVVIVGGIYYLTREEKIELSLKNKKEIIVEYGNTVQYSFDDLIQTKDIDKDKLKEMKKRNQK